MYGQHLSHEIVAEYKFLAAAASDQGQGRTARLEPLQQVIRRAQSLIKPDDEVQWIVDIDPMEML